MIKNLIHKISSILLPTDNEQSEETVQRKGIVAPRQRVLDKLKEHFLEELNNETTTESLLYHTSYTVYIREAEYDRLSPSFAQTVRDAINVFVRELQKIVKRYPNYQSHSKYWEIQLVALPHDAVIDGISWDRLNEEPIIIKSKLFADSSYDSRMKADERCVVTVHTKDSSKQLPNALNLAALKGLTELAKDKYRVEFSLGDTLLAVPMSEAEKSVNTNTVVKATLNIVDGDFIIGDNKYRLFNMTNDQLLVSGKFGAAGNQGVDEIHINDENILSPSLKISRDAQTGKFTIVTWGDVNVNRRNLANATEYPLSNNSAIMINGDYQINFKIK